jgi:hypothetical protein
MLPAAAPVAVIRQTSSNAAAISMASLMTHLPLIVRFGATRAGSDPSIKRGRAELGNSRRDLCPKFILSPGPETTPGFDSGPSVV